MLTLIRYNDYTRRDVHSLFSTQTTFTPQAGTWGLRGIVSIPDTNDYIFFVTIGSRQAGHSFVEGITEDGILTWQSQPKHKLTSNIIEKFISHNEQIDHIYLFYRISKKIPTYTYLGQLAYRYHDPSRENPVYFHWQILDWDPPESIINKCNIGDVYIARGQTVEEGLDVSPRIIERFLIPEPVSIPPENFHARHINFVAQYDRNIKIGDLGESLVFEEEKKLLIEANRQDLAGKVFLTRERLGNNAPYDVHSYFPDGSIKYIEVKTTTGSFYSDFYISQREIEFGRKNLSHYRLYRVYDLDISTGHAEFVELQNIESFCTLEATNYKAKFDLLI